MDEDHFKQLVVRLERESAGSPAGYRTKVAALTLLGFAILGVLLGAIGIGLLALVGIVAAVVFTGGAAWLLLLKFGKVLLLLAIPLWYLCRSGVRALFVRLPAPQGREITAADAPALFAALHDMQRRMHGPRFHHVLLGDEVNAAVVQRPAFGLIGWPRNYLLLGLPLLEAMPPAEALAVVAHEYGHLAGSHGRFSAFIYRLRHSWGTIEAFAEHIEGWLGKMVAPLVRWYAPYFNAYTFVLARTDEYRADAASGALVGAANTAHALKRMQQIQPRHQHFMRQTFERIDHDAAPPPDLMGRWAATARELPAEAQVRRWLADALDRTGHLMDTHPTLRARLAALAAADATTLEPPPPLQGASAAQAWLGAQLERLRGEITSRWAEQVARPWAEQHAAVNAMRTRLAELRAMPAPHADQQIEALRLTLRLEPGVDLRDTLRAFNAAHTDHAQGLFLEGTVQLDQGERDGLALLDRAMALDPEAGKPACERAHAFLTEHAEPEAAELYAQRWRQRDELETRRAHQLGHIDGGDALVAHGLDAAVVQAVRQTLDAAARRDVARLFLARRPIPADPTVQQFIVGVELTWWARQRSRQQQVVDRLSAIAWPIPVVVLTLGGRFAGFKKRFAALADARLV